MADEHPPEYLPINGTAIGYVVVGTLTDPADSRSYHEFFGCFRSPVRAREFAAGKQEKARTHWHFEAAAVVPLRTGAVG